MRGLLKTLFASALGLLLLASPALAAGYATDDAGVLYQVVPDQPAIERIGPVQVTTKAKDGTTSTTRPTLTDLALSDLHGLYGISYDTLYRIDMRDPSKSVRIGALRKTGFGQFNALAFDEEGRLFALEYGVLHQVDLKTGLARVLGSLGGNWGSDGDLAWVGDALYATVNGGGGAACHLVRINMKTWKATDVGRIRETAKVTTGAQAGPQGKAGTKGKESGPAPAPKAKGEAGPRRRPLTLRHFDDVWGLVWDGRDLYGVTPQGELLQIDYRSGRAVVVLRVRATFYGACAMLRI